jgi:MacB-like periplasmic core domain
MIGGRRFGSARGRRALDDLDEDIHDHIERETQDNIERGMAPEEARRQARLTFGNVALAKEDTRRVWVSAWLDEARQDFRYAARALRQNRAFATAAAATLALAIGANTTMFSVLNAVLLRPLPYRDAEQLAMLWTEDPTQTLREGRSALWNVQQWRRQSQTFADIAVFDGASTTLTGPDGAEQIAGAIITPNLLPVLGVQPVQGRSFSTAEAEQRQRLVLMSHRFWQARFGGSKDAIGATIVLNGIPFQIIGVLPAGFEIATVNADVWLPRTMSTSERGADTWFVIGRLRPA